MRRAVGDDEASWGLYPSYYHGGDRYHQHDNQATDLLVEDEPHHRGTVPTTDPAKRHAPGRNGAAGSPLKGLTVAHNPLVRRTLRRPSRGASTRSGP